MDKNTTLGFAPIGNSRSLDKNRVRRDSLKNEVRHLQFDFIHHAFEIDGLDAECACAA